MMKGNIFITTDMNVVMGQFNSRDPNTKLVFIDAEDPALVQQLNGIKATVLLPDYNGTCARLDNNMDLYRNLYIQHLLSEGCMSYIAVIMRALINGTNILLYMNKDSYDMYFPILYEFIMNSFGLSIGTIQTPPIFNTNFIPQVCNLLYTFNLFTFEEYMVLYPAGIPMDDSVVAKMIEDVNPATSLCDGTFESYRTYFYNYKEQTKQTGKFLRVVARKVEG